MRLTKYLNEEYFKRIRGVEIFVNPTRKEMIEIDSGGIRFTAIHSEKKVYMWNAWDLLHNQFAKAMGLPDWSKDPNRLEGVAERIGRKWIASHSDQLFELTNTTSEERIELAKTILKKNWTWLVKYIRIKGFLGEYKNEISRLS